MKTYFFAVIPLLSFLALLPATSQHHSHLPVSAHYSNALLGASSVNSQQHQYVCSPCGNDCDNRVYDKPGNCSVCGMALIDRATIGYKDIDFEAVCARVKANPKVVLLDVRSPA